MCNVELVQTPMCCPPGNVRISDLGLAVELKEGKTMTKGYAGTPGGSQVYSYNENVYLRMFVVIVSLCFLKVTCLQRC